MRKIICPNCGAEFDANLPECPYCDFINPEGAEDKFMMDLESKRSDLAKLPDEAEVKGVYGDEIKTNSGKAASRVLKAGLALLLILAVGFALGRAFDGFDSDDDGDYVEELVWQNEHFPEFDELYAKGDYDGVLKLFDKYGDEHEIYQWAHFSFFEYYESIKDLREIIADNSDSKLDSTDATSLLYNASKFYYREYEREVKDSGDITTLDSMREEALDIIHERLGFSDAQMEEFRPTLYEDNRYISWTEANKIAKKYIKNFK